jgi:hypothetical protein
MRINRMSSIKKTTRIAGILYLLNGISSGFALGYVIAKTYMAGNAATTGQRT